MYTGYRYYGRRCLQEGKGEQGECRNQISLPQFDERLSDNLYKIWNRLSSGSYFPPAVKEQEIRKDNGKTRKLGIPTVADRVAQQVIKDYLEPRLEETFHDSSYGCRPLKSAHQALAGVRENVRDYVWVTDPDITAFFDNADHEKMMLALDRHVDEKWVRMYVKRWLEAPVAKANGDLIVNEGKGTPQGGVISPLLANLYLHYSFDKWMEISFPEVRFERYADDMVIHCKTEAQANYILDKIRGWIQYYDKFQYRTLTKVFHRLHYRLTKWIVSRFKRFRRSRRRALHYLKYVRARFPNLFYHWTIGYPIV